MPCFLVVVEFYPLVPLNSAMACVAVFFGEVSFEEVNIIIFVALATIGSVSKVANFISSDWLV